MKAAKLSVFAFVLAFITLTLASCGPSDSKNSSSTSDYTIGGTASGLAGTLVLQDNGADDLTITADGEFTFPVKVVDGASYAVSVKTQPAGAICTVNNGTGVVRGADVMNVTVICSSQSYAIGGTVSGLAGTLVLQDNKADDLTLSANGAFTFATQVADGAGYAVTVKTQPTGQTCTVNQETGVVTGSTVANISVTCSASAYTIGGSLSGLTGTIVLQNNSADDLTLTASGAFTFATKVADGAGYSVTVKANPVGATCTVTNGTGVVSSSNISTVTVSCTVIPRTAISGSVFAASVSSASVIVKDMMNNTIAGPVLTAADGTYTIDVLTSDLAGSLRFIATGGTFVDEATGLNTSAASLAAYVEGGKLSTGSAVHLDPSSTILHTMVTAGSGTSFACAKALFNSAFGYIPDTAVAPMNTAPAAGNASNRLAALRAATFSQMAKDLGITPGQQFDLMTAIAADLTDDGKLNGSAAPVNGVSLADDTQNKFERALVGFLSNSSGNHTGLTTAEIGILPFGKVMLTHDYRVEYIPGLPAATVGKSKLQIKVTYPNNGLPVTGLSPMLMPMMHMATMGHSAPVDMPMETVPGSGIYDCTVYWRMATMSGFWSLDVMLDDNNTATFYPYVASQSTSDKALRTISASFQSTNLTTDSLKSMGTMSTYRKYYAFADGVDTGSSTFNLFIGADQTMSFNPAVSVGTVLSSPTGTVYAAGTFVEVSTNGTNTVSATDNGGGHWSASGLTGLSSGVTTTLWVKLSINGELKSSNTTTTISSANDHQLFKITPP